MDLTARQFRPEPVRESAEVQDYLPVETINARFELMHPPLAWEVKGGKWLPVLSQIYFLRGLNNYDDMGVLDAEAVRTVYRHKGCATLDPAGDKMGEFQHYMCTVPAISRGTTGKYYLTMFDRPVMVAGKVLWERDTAEYDRFRAHLVDAGYCVMNATIAQLVINVKKSTLVDYEQVPMGANRLKTIEKLKADIATMEAAREGLVKPSAAAQAPRRTFKADRVREENA